MLQKSLLWWIVYKLLLCSQLQVSFYPVILEESFEVCEHVIQIYCEEKTPFLGLKVISNLIILISILKNK